MIFPWLWRVLPGNPPIKILLLVILVAGLALVLFELVFPQLESFFTPPPVVDVETKIP